MLMGVCLIVLISLFVSRSVFATFPGGSACLTAFAGTPHLHCSAQGFLQKGVSRLSRLSRLCPDIIGVASSCSFSIGPSTNAQ